MSPRHQTDEATFRAVLDSVFAGREYRWADEPVLLRWLREGWQALGEWLRSLRADNPMLFRLLVFGLLVVLILIFAHAAYVVWRTVREGSGPLGPATPRATREIRDAAWYLREADRAASQGRLAAALQLAFVGLALTLESKGLLQYHSSKTPAECAREAQLAEADRKRLLELVRTLYGHVFGGRPLSPDEYRRWRELSAMEWHAPAH
jgi:Domain of unknown function (DUF4129)